MHQLPPELILLLSQFLAQRSLSSLVRTCRRLHTILQPELDALITPTLGRKLLLKAAVNNPYIVAKLVAPPFLIPPSDGYDNLHEEPRPDLDWEEEDDVDNDTPLHCAASAGNQETASLLLAAGADVAATCGCDAYQPLHLASLKEDLPMMTLLLDHGAPIDTCFGYDGCRETALHNACWIGHIPMVELLLARGANIECYGHNGSALGFAVANRQLEVVRLLLDRGANAAVTVPFLVSMSGLRYKPGDTASAALDSAITAFEHKDDKCLKEIATMLKDALPKDPQG
ncbi:ankyrin repeat-containing domain protein [Mycena olivaceomarginata]|nr:ankyrin repeat-containing domain protein [Mycena olivaceomarginata]KAJ7824966.1 ankyrin repeat-containing domain protein [Mycena olivaceomarginata]